MDEPRRRGLEAELIQQWREIEDLEADEAEDHFKSKKEKWFLQAFSFLRDLPQESHCWCGHKEIMLPLLEPFYGYFQETASDSSLRVLWRRLSKEMRGCTRCVVQHHKAKEFYVAEFVEEVVKPLLDVICALDEERVAQHMKELLGKFNMAEVDPTKDSVEVICIMFEVLMFPSLLDDAEINETLKPFLRHVEETHDLSLAAGQRYPGVYRLLLHTDQGVRRIALKLAHSLPKFKDEQDMESIQPTLEKCIRCLECDTFDSCMQPTAKPGPPFYGRHRRPRTIFTKEALWIGLTTILSVLEMPALLKGVMEKHPMFVSIVLNHVSEATGVFWNALRCLKLLLEVLGYKLWLVTTFTPGVMRNTLLTQCFHSHEERMHIPIFDLFQPLLQSLEALQDGEYENQRRALLYFLLQQVPLSNNFKSLMTKKARHVAFAIIGRGYSMDPPLPPVECVHVWGPALVATLKDTDLITSLRQSAADLFQSIIVADAAALATVSAQQGCPTNFGKYSLDRFDDDGDEAAEETEDTRSDVMGDAKYWISFLSVTRSVEACELWSCVPLLWVEVLNGIVPRYLPLSLTKGIMWALSRLSIIDSGGGVILNNMVVTSDGVDCFKDMAEAFKWVKPKGYDDGATGGCVNAVKAGPHHEELVGFLKKYAEKYLSRLQDGVDEQGGWTWEARMAEPCILLPLDANAIFREFGKEVLRRAGKAGTLEAGLEILCSSEASAAAATRGLCHALKLLLRWPLHKCSRGLQQFFFHVWKLLTLGDKESQRHTHPLQVSQGGGFLNQPKLQTLSLDDSLVSPVSELQRDGEAWRKLCTLVSCQLWPLLVKTIIEGRQHLEAPGQLMTFTRMLQLLPCVFRNLNASQKKRVFLDTSRARPVLGDSIDFTWFEAFIRWGDVPSPIIQRWWKEAVGSILEDLKGWELVLSSELEDMMVDLRKPGLQLEEPRRLQLTTLLLSVPKLVLEHKFLDNEVAVIPFKVEKLQSSRKSQQGDQGNCIALDTPETEELSSAHNGVIDLTDDLLVRASRPSNEVIDLTNCAHGRSGSTAKEVIDLTDDSESRSPPSATLYGRHLEIDDPLPPVRKQLNLNVGENSSGSSLKPEEPHFRRPSVRQMPVSSWSKSATLDRFLEKFSSNKAQREVKKPGSHVQSRSNSFKVSSVKGVLGKSQQKSGSRLSSLRNEHREDLEQRSAVEGFVRSQVRERVERGATAKQTSVAEVTSDTKKLLNGPTPDVVPLATCGSDPEPRTSDPLDSILKELVRDNEADPLDAAFESVRKTQFLGPTQPLNKPRRKLITLALPGESERGGTNLAKSQIGLVIKPRQIPRLDDWYKRILCLDYLSVVGISDEDTPPGSIFGEQLEKVPSTFKSPEQYMSIFRPLVLEEFKSQLQRCHEELCLSDATTTGILRQMSLERVDEFQMGRFMAEAGSDGAARACTENELLLLSRQSLQSGSQSCHLLAKVESRDRERGSRATVLVLKLYVQAGDARLTKARRLLVDRSKWHVTRIMNITPQVREFQALSNLASLPLLPILLSPGSGHQVKWLENVSSCASWRSVPVPLQSKLRVDYNESQLRAIAAAIGGTETMTNDHQLTLVQGPPGTGKTKTIVAILSVLLAIRPSKRNPKVGKENEPFISRSGSSSGHTSASKSSSRDAAALSRAWQDAARAIELFRENESRKMDLQGQKQRVLVCAQSNAAVDEIVARICKNGLYGIDGSFFRPSVVRVGTLKSVHPKSLPVFIDTLVDMHLGSEKECEPEAVQDNEQTKLGACRSKLEEAIEFIQAIEALRSQSKNIEGEQTEQKTALSESVFGAMAAKVIALGNTAVTAKLNLLYTQRRALSAELATAAKEEKKAYEESKNRRKSIRRDIIRQADVVVTTLSGCGGDIYNICMESIAGGKKSKPVQECFFDAVVIDEAAQALEPATLIPFQLLVQTNARCVMVGDPKQLPATVLSQTASRMQYECSMFERLQGAGYPVTMLSTQYRMHPEIRQFPSEHFYDNLITDGGDLKANRKAIFHRDSGFGPYSFFDVMDGQESRKGGFASQSLSNVAEGAVAVQLYLTLRKRYPAELWDGRVGVITPYKQQLRVLQEEFVKTLGPAAASEVEFNTVDGFQGREVDILILSTVRASTSVGSKSGDIGFVADVRRMNVALTRARFSLWIIGNAATLQGNPSWASLLSNAKRRSILFSLKKPYALFFQNPIRFDTSHSSSSFTKSSEGHKISKVLGDPPIKSEWSKAAFEVGPGRPKESRVNLKDSKETLLDSRIKGEHEEVVLNGGDKRSPDGSRQQAPSKRDEELKVRSSIRGGRASEVRVAEDRSSRESSQDERSRTESKRHHTGQDRESAVEDRTKERLRQNSGSRYQKERESLSRPEKKRNHSGNDQASVEAPSSVEFTEVKKSHEFRNEGSSSRKEAHGETLRAGTKRHHSQKDGAIVGARSLGRSQSQTNTGSSRWDRNSNVEERLECSKRDGRALEEKSEDRLFRDGNSAACKGDYGRWSTDNDYKERKSPRGEDDREETRNVIARRNCRSSAERAHVRDRGFDGSEAAGLRKPSGSRHTNIPVPLKDGDERKEPRSGDERKGPRNGDERKEPRNGDDSKEPLNGDERKEPRNGDERKEPRNGDERKEPRKESRLVDKQESALVKEKTNVDGAGPGPSQALQTGLHSKAIRNGPPNRRTSQEELTAARKRKRAEVAALLPSGLLTSKVPGPPVLAEKQIHAAVYARPTREHGAKHSTGPVRSQPSDPNCLNMDHEWAQFQKALGGSKPAVPSRAQTEAASGVSIKAQRMPVRDSERPRSKQSESGFDLDNILSGLSSVTQAQAKGRQLITPSKPTSQTSGFKSMASKNF